MDPTFVKANEIHFRLGIIYKQQGKYKQSLQQFTKILNHPPKPLSHLDIWFQIGHCCECEKEFNMAKDSYEHILQYQPKNAKVLQQLAWLYHSQFHEVDKAIAILNKAIEMDKDDAHAWYLLGRCYMSKKDFTKAYEAYQYAVYKDPKNPTVWCSIGVLYYTKGQVIPIYLVQRCPRFIHKSLDDQSVHSRSVV
jgi:general transcriptional corepressor CYC8